MFAAGEDRNLELLTRGLTPCHRMPVYGEAPYYLTDPSTLSTSSGTHSGLSSYAGSYYLSPMMSQEYLIGTPIFQPSVGTLSSSSLRVFANRDFIKDYPEIRGSVYWNPVIESCRISMVVTTSAPSHNSSSRYPSIRGFEVFDARTLSNMIVQNLNSNFNIIRLQTIIESIQRMIPQDSSLLALAQQRAKAVGQIIAAEPSR
jgi:hypothetical protein